MQDLKSVEKVYNAEISKSERSRALILIGLLGLEAIILLVIYFFYREEYLQIFKTHIAIYAILIFTFLIIVYEFFVLYLIGNSNRFYFRNPRVFGYFNSFSEVSLLSLLLIFIVEYSNQTIILQTPATLTYFIFIVLSTFRLNFKLSVFTGALAAIEYILISIYYSTYFGNTPVDITHPDLTGMQYLGQGLIMLITGIAAGFAADLIKKKMLVSWNNIKEKNEVIDLFGQQISPQIADNILKNHNELSGARKKVSIMFLDIRQFTPFVEQHQPEEVVSYLNSLFGFMIDIVQTHHGVINQFLGDGFMATFGAPVSIENSSQHATEAAQKIIDNINWFTAKYSSVDGWRKSQDWYSSLKNMSRAVGQASSSGGKGKADRLIKATHRYITKATALSVKVKNIKNKLPVNDSIDLIKALELDRFAELLDKHIDLVERRLIKGEKIPHDEKIFSLFEQYTEWITKGKSRPNVELGKKLSITTDQFGLIIDYYIMENESDSEIVLSTADRVLSKYNIFSWSFDKGYWHKDNKELLNPLVKELIMPKKGKRNIEETEEERTSKFKKLRNKHSAIESNINELGHNGLNRCPDRGYVGFKRYIGLGIVAHNLQRLGKEILKQKLAEEKRKRVLQNAA